MKTFSISKVVLSLTTIVGASMPFATRASDTPALDLCVHTFVKEVVPADRAAEIRRDEIVGSIASMGANRTKVDLVAQGEKHAKVFGRATCVMDGRGTLVAMYLYNAEPGPLGLGRPRVLARNVDTTQLPRTAFVDQTKPF